MNKPTVCNAHGQSGCTTRHGECYREIFKYLTYTTDKPLGRWLMPALSQDARRCAIFNSIGPASHDRASVRACEHAAFVHRG